jgi:hypothetical protein
MALVRATPEGELGGVPALSLAIDESNNQPGGNNEKQSN